MRCVLFVLAGVQVLAAQTLRAIHERALWRDTHGEIRFTADGISFRAAKQKDNRTWKYSDIQHFDRVSTREFVLLTYGSQRWALGREKRYHFVITAGELSDDLFRIISERLGKPVTNRVAPEDITATHTIPVKHRHTFGGCEGTLEFTDDTIYYSTANRKDARVWRLDSDVQSIFSADPYRLDIQAYDDNRREFSATRLYSFKLKERLDPAFYRDLKLKLYNLLK